MIRIVISGIAGRMGRQIGLLASAYEDVEIAGALEAEGHPSIGRDIGEILGIGETGKKVEYDFEKFSCDCLIEFTNPQATIEHLEVAYKRKVSMVIGTTALKDKELERIRRYAMDIPIVLSPNMSVGANLLFKITEEVSGSLSDEYGIEIIEAHHSKKKDAPSGTARRLAEAVSKVKGKMPAVHSIRIGDIVGEHTVIFAGPGERIELTHRAHSRDAFARGALDAARFIAKKKSGLYTMQDVIR